MNRYSVLFTILFICIFAGFAGSAEIVPVDPMAPPEMQSVLSNVTDAITSTLDSIQEANRISAESMGKTGISGTLVHDILTEKLANVTYGHSSLVISPEGIVTAAAPDPYADLIGKNLLYQDQVQSAIAEKKPGMSDLFPMEEGFSGISVTYPIFSDTGTYLGYTDVTIIPEELLSRIIVPIQKDTGMEVFVIQDDGLTLYETNPEEIGRNIISDPLYNTPTMQAATESVMENETGTIRYTFWNTEWNRQVPREATWTTLYYGGQEWRIGVIRNQNDADQSASVIDDFVSDPVIVKDAVSDQIRFVDDAVRFARSVGKEEACRVFNDLSGPYVSKAGYIYAYDKNGTPLALPYQQGLIGTSRINLTDINGLAIMPAMTDLAQEGGGSMYIVYPNPTDNFRNQLKIEYLLPVDAEWFVGSGIYLPEIPAEISPGEISALIDRVNTVASHGYKVGKKEAIQDFNDLNQSFADGGRYIFAYGYDGTTLALPYQPELVGTNRSSFSDAYGSPVLLLEIKAAQRGGGFVYVVYQNPDTGTDELKLCYVLPAGDDWLAGSGIYTGTALAQ